MKLKFLDPFEMISLISALMSIHNVKLISNPLGRREKIIKFIFQKPKHYLGALSRR